MRFSEAMRIGFMVTAPIRGSLWNHDGTGSCALGAGYVTLGITRREHLNRLPELCPIVCMQTPLYTRINDFESATGSVAQTIAILNDKYGIDRRWLADMVEGIEEAERLKALWATQAAAPVEKHELACA